MGAKPPPKRGAWGNSLVVNFGKASVNNFSRCFLVKSDNIDEVFLQQV